MSKLVELDGKQYLRIIVLERYLAPSSTGQQRSYKISGRDLSKYLTHFEVKKHDDCKYVNGYGYKGELDDLEVYTFQCNPYGLEPAHMDATVKSNNAWMLSQIKIQKFWANGNMWK